MAQLRTDYKDEILNVSVNTQRKYRMINNDDGTVSFVDETVYLQNGDTFGAAELNEISRQLLGGGSKIRYNEETDTIQINYNGEWTDWKRAGLSWNGYIFNNGDACGSVTGGWTLSVKGTFGNNSTFGVASTSIKFYSSSSGHSGTSILATEKPIDFKGFSKVRIKGTCKSAGDSWTTTFAFGFGSSRSTMDKTLYSKTVNSSTLISIDQTYDLSSYQDLGARYFMLSAVNSSGSGYAQLDITEIQFFNE